MADLKQIMQSAAAKMARAEKAATSAIDKAKEKPDDAKLGKKANDFIAQHNAAIDAYDKAKADVDAEEAAIAANQGNETKNDDAENKPALESSGVMITITAKRKKGFWRCGVFHPGEAVEHPLESFTEQEWERLRSEPRLIVEE